MTDWKSKYEALCDEHEQQVEAWCELKVKYDAQSAEGKRLGQEIFRRNKLIGKKNTEIRYLRKFKWDIEHRASTRHADESHHQGICKCPRCTFEARKHSEDRKVPSRPIERKENG